MPDVFSATVTPDKAAYNDGDKATLTLSGNDVVTGSTTETLSISGTVKNQATGATGPFGPVVVNLTVPTSETDPLVFDSITDSKGNSWAIAADGVHASAVVHG